MTTTTTLRSLFSFTFTVAALAGAPSTADAQVWLPPVSGPGQQMPVQYIRTPVCRQVYSQVCQPVCTAFGCWQNCYPTTRIVCEDI